MKSNLIDKTQNNSAVIIHHGQLQNTNNTYDSSCSYPEIETKGEQQPRRCNDVIWAVLFYAHIGALIAVTVKFLPMVIDQWGRLRNYYDNFAQGDDAAAYNKYSNYVDNYYRRVSTSEFHQSSSLTSLAVGVGTRGLVQVANLGGLQLSNVDVQDRSLQDQETGADPKGISLLVGLTVVGAFCLSILSLGLMIRFAEGLIKMSLFFNICIGLITSVAGFVSGSTEAGIMGLIIFVLAVCYAFAIWSRIPFAAANLITASTAIQANMGVTVFAFGAIILNGLWMVFWSVSAYSTLYVLGGCDIDGTCANDIPAVYSFLFLLSLYWTAQVIKNVVHVTVAGTVGTWWWAPLEANSCCSSAVMDSHKRALSYSFGSICLGSLLVAIIQTLKSLAESARQNDDGILKCIADCVLGCLETIMEIFNEWAFVYVGLYGYSFVEAAKNVMTLFKARGWTAIITDYMVDRVLLMISFGNGMLSGALAAGISYTLQLNLEGIAFGVGFLVGLILTSVVLSVVGSGVNTVIVCYAEDPATFEINHFDLSMRMRSSWREAFPNDFNY
jgi:Plasma-membrane choline transporter.